ncbi:MAG TPA: hypothetical protein VJ969_06745, partial [Desulfopila sp.]|nr:hypothetical protein [Desulfopila sp.]
RNRFANFWKLVVDDSAVEINADNHAASPMGVRHSDGNYSTLFTTTGGSFFYSPEKNSKLSTAGEAMPALF